MIYDLHSVEHIYPGYSGTTSDHVSIFPVPLPCTLQSG